MAPETPAAATAIELNNVYKIYGKVPEVLGRLSRGEDKAQVLAGCGAVVALNAINLKIAKGELFVIMGLSGSGKSTLLRLLNALIPVSTGDVIVSGRNVAAMDARELRRFRARHVSMVFQHFGLLPHRTVLQNVMYGLRVQGVAPADAEQQARNWIRQVGLDGFEMRYPHDLSGGMRQRVGLARALATDAEVLLMDEAFSALDPLIRRDMQDLLLDLQQRMHKTVVFITHDLDEALRLGDRIAIISDGTIIQNGTPLDILMKPATDFVRSFTRGVNRAAVLKVEHIMRPPPASFAAPARAGQPRIVAGAAAAAEQLEARGAPRAVALGTRLDNALDRFAFDSGPLAVTDPDGNVVGLVEQSAIVRAIVDDGG